MIMMMLALVAVILFFDIVVGIGVVHRFPRLYLQGESNGYPVLLFADVIFADNCVTWTSRYHSDGRPNLDYSNLRVLIKLEDEYGRGGMMHEHKYKNVKPILWKSNAIGLDTPVLQVQFCDLQFFRAAAVIMKVQYKNESSNEFYIPRLSLSQVDAAACTSTSLRDIWSARAWIEHHRNLGVGRFNIYVNDLIPDSDNSSIGIYINYLLSQPDVILVEWPFPFKDPNTTRDKVYSPMHYARPLEWNSCNEREHYGAKVTLFNDMDEFVITKFKLIDLFERFPSWCRAILLGHIWVKIRCPNNDTSINNFAGAFDSLEKLQKCQMWRHKDMSLDSRRRTKLIVRTDIRTTHAILNHDLGSPGVKEECKVKSSEIASFFHIINMRPNSK